MFFIEEEKPVKEIGFRDPDAHELILDFAWIALIGAVSGFSAKETGRMTIVAWSRLFDAYKRQHNMTVNRLAFVDPERAVSAADL